MRATKVLSERFALIGVARSEATAESWREHLYGMAQSFVGNAAAEFDVDHIDEPVWKQLEEKMTYIARALRKASRRSRRNRKRRTAPKGTPSFISQKISFS
jgi:glucose-6-phosphate 1-dehydrogenase